MINTVIIPNSIAMILLLILLLSANSVSRHVRLLDSKIFVMMATCNFLQCAGEIITYSIDGIMSPGFHTLILVVNSALYIVNIFFAFLWVLYADYKIFENVERVKERSKRLILPAFAIMICSIVNLFVPVFFKVTENNHYKRTPLFIIPYLVTYFYLAYGTVFIYRHKNQAKKYVFLPAVVFMMPILLGSAVQYFCNGVSTVWVGVAIALVALYVNVQNEVSYTDTLSGLYTRIYMYQYLESALRKKDTQKKIAGIMLDIDEFKRINDTYGHLTGDNAIRLAGKFLHDTLPDNSIAARYGGDEFVVLLQIKTEEDIINILNRITEAEANFNGFKGKAYSIHFSKGYAVLDPATDTIDSFIEKMDSIMYEAKKSRKEQNNIIDKANEDK